MREFADVMRRLLVRNNSLVKEVVGEAFKREVSSILDPIALIEGHALSASYRATGHLMFLRDGLLRLCNSRLSLLYQAAGQLPESSDIAKIIESLGPSNKEREQLVVSRAVDLALLSESKGSCRVLLEMLPMTPPAERAALLDLFVTAPSLIECVEQLVKSAAPRQIGNALAALVTPLPFAADGASLAQLIVEAQRGKSPGFARLLYDQRDFLTGHLCQPENQKVAAFLLALMNHEVQQGKKTKEVTALVIQVADEIAKKRAPHSAWEILSQRADAVNYVHNTGDRPVEASLSVKAQDGAKQVGDANLGSKKTWAQWVLSFLQTDESQRAFLEDFSAHGAKQWFRTLLLTPAQRAPYLQALNAGDDTVRGQCLEAARAASEKGGQTTSAAADQQVVPISHYTKIVFIGGQYEPQREEGIKTLLPPASDVRFYYAEGGATSFRNVSPAALSGDGKTLVVYRPNFTGHSMYYRAVSIAESAGSRLIVLPKGAQNPDVIVQRMSDALNGRAQDL
jgi:hypothetical protein